MQGDFMESKAKILGHPAHPILIVFPLGLLATSVIFDLIDYFSLLQISPVVGFWMAVSGVIGGLISAPFGFIDWLAIPSETRAKRVGLIHAIVNVLALILFALSIYGRSNNLNYTASTLSVILSVLGLFVALVGGWFGGELVHRLDVSNDPEANLNASNSLWARSDKIKDV
jgi:uncharacterized membrane protein